MEMPKLARFKKTAASLYGQPLHRAIFISICATYALTLQLSAEVRAGTEPAVASKPAVKKASSRVPTEEESILNFHKVHPYLYRSGEPPLESLARLKELGIVTIIDLRSFGPAAQKEKAQAEKLGMRYISMPMDYHAPTDEQVKTLLDEIDLAKKTMIKNEGRKPVLVHCQHGSDRTGAMVGIWRVRRDGWNYEDTYKEMRKYFFGPKFTLLSGAVRKAADETRR